MFELSSLTVVAIIVCGSFIGCFGAVKLLVWLDNRKTETLEDGMDRIAEENGGPLEGWDDGESEGYWNDTASMGEADGDALASAGFGTDEDYGGCDERY